MAEQRKRDAWVLALYGLLVVAGLGLLATGVVRYFTHEGEVLLLGLGVVAVIVPAALFPVGVALSDRGARSIEASGEAGEIAQQLRSISERLMISESAKRIAFREQDRAALRKAIEDEMGKNDFEAALALVEEMRNTYGYHLEAEQFRRQIEDARAAEINHRISELIDQLDELIRKHEWDHALREAAAINRMYPDSPRTADLTAKVRNAFEQYKGEMERRFLQAAARDDIETAMDLLKDLDKYLSEQEAEPYREAARGVITKKRDNLGVQFKLAVHDREWTRAVAVGEEIIRDFPNTKMAEEVRQIIDVLRERAADEQAARQPDTASKA